MPGLLGQQRRTWLEGRGRPQEVTWHPVLPPCPPVLQVSAPGSVLWVGDGLMEGGVPGRGVMRSHMVLVISLVPSS